MSRNFSKIKYTKTTKIIAKKSAQKIYISSIAIELNSAEFEVMSWNDFVSGVHDEELINYLKSKRLYVNN